MQPRALEDWDLDGLYIRSLARAEVIAAESGLAIQNALQRHPVTKYVQNCPVEDIYEDFSKLHPAISDSYFEAPSKRYVEWGLPGRDSDLSTRMGCGFKFTAPASMTFTACEADHSHYIKASRIHCWRLACPNCMNDVCLKRGAQLEKKILAYSSLERRAGRRVPQLKHWVVSPPQEWAIEIIQNADLFPFLVTYIQYMLIEFGFLGGAMVFHPWRLQDDEWVLGPHFHIVGYGFVDNRKIHEKYGCVVKQIHPGERIRSVRQTIAYLLTHAGIGYAERDEDDIDFDMAILNYFIPGLANGDDTGYSEKDYEDMGTRHGRVNGDLDIDWLEWTKRRYTQNFNAIRTFGVCSRKSIKVIEVWRETRTRQCPECGAKLCIYHGFDDTNPELSTYIHDSPIMVSALNYHLVKDVLQKFRSDLENEGYTAVDVAISVPMLTCPQVMGLDDYDSEAAVFARQKQRNMIICYVPSMYGEGMDPVVMTRDQARSYEETGVLPEGVVHEDPIRVITPMDRIADRQLDELREEILREAEVNGGYPNIY